MDKFQYEMKSPVGPIFLVASDHGLEGVFLQKQAAKLLKKLNPSKPIEKNLAYVSRQLNEYFSGKRKQFDIAFQFSGTPFQNRVWKELSKIPFGKTVSYQTIARRIKNPKAVRAVGSANKRNPYCIVVPCHRVINANGLMGGYAGGLPMKQELLELEQKHN